MQWQSCIDWGGLGAATFLNEVKNQPPENTTHRCDGLATAAYASACLQQKTEKMC